MTLRTIPSMLRSLCSFAVLGGFCALGACGDDDAPPPTPDAGVEDLGVDLGTPDLGPSYPPGATCDDAHVLVGAVGETSSLSFDTTDEPSGMRDIGFDCGSQEAARWAPQHVVAYTVPGSGLQRVDFTLVNPGTGRRVDTVLQVRTRCDRIPVPFFSCFEDVSARDLRSAGAATAMGGDTLYIFVTTLAETPYMGWTDRGPIELTVTARSASAPTITAGSAFAIGRRFEFNATGGDVDGDALGVRARFLDAAGEPVDLSGDGVPDENDVPKRFFLTSVASMLTFSGTAEFAGLTRIVSAARPPATQAELTVFDGGFLQSTPLVVPVVTLSEAGTGGTCDASIRCRRPLVCEAGVCAATPEVAGLCSAAIPLAIPVPAGETTTVSVTGTAGAAADRFTPELCRGANDASLGTGGEVLYSLVVPAGTFDLVARTDIAGTVADQDTIVYVRSDCADPGTETGCSDDVAARDFRSQTRVRDVTAGTYTIVVDTFGGPGAMADYTLAVSLRPVLATGARCDPAEVRNRCAGTACPPPATAGGPSICP